MHGADKASVTDLSHFPRVYPVLYITLNPFLPSRDA